MLLNIRTTSVDLSCKVLKFDTHLLRNQSMFSKIFGEVAEGYLTQYTNYLDCL